MRPVFMAVAVALALSGPAFGADAGIDPRIADNPVLAQLHAVDPAAALRVLGEIEALEAATAGRLPKGATRGVTLPDPADPEIADADPDAVDADTQRVLDENPVFRELYARDRGATLKLIRLVIGE